MPPPVKLQIFVSSTFTDLRQERQAAVEAILDNGHIPAGMELFAAGSEEQLKVIRTWIDESDILVLLLGGRYGSVEPKSQKSYTQLEYEYAEATGKPLFAIVMTDESRQRRVESGESLLDLTEQSHQSRLQDFKAGVTSKMCRFAHDTKDLRLEIGRSIRQLEGTHSFSGWQRGLDTAKTLAEVTAMASRIDELQESVRKLELENTSLRQKSKKAMSFGERSFEEVLLDLSSQKVQLRNGSRVVEVSLAEALDVCASTLTAGISDAPITDDAGRQLFRDVAAPLCVYGMTEKERAPSKSPWTKYVLSEQGKRFVAEFRRRKGGDKQAR